jgi:hypothetical protein
MITKRVVSKTVDRTVLTAGGNPVATPEHNFTGDREAWEQTVFENADHFTVFRYLANKKRDQKEYRSLVEAIRDAGSDSHALLYAVTGPGRFVNLPRADWPRHLNEYAIKRAGVARAAIRDAYGNATVTDKQAHDEAYGALITLGCIHEEAVAIAKLAVAARNHQQLD